MELQSYLIFEWEQWKLSNDFLQVMIAIKLLDICIFELIKNRAVFFIDPLILWQAIMPQIAQVHVHVWSAPDIDKSFLVGHYCSVYVKV